MFEANYYLASLRRFARSARKDIELKNKSWTVELEAGLAALYLDNRSLLGMLDRVIEASETADPARLKPSLIDLQAELLARFEREAQLMRAFKYEFAAQHLAEHQQLSAEIQSMINDLDASAQGVAFVGRFMRNWLLQHIVGKDTLFAEALVTQNGTTDRRHAGVGLSMDDDEIDLLEERRLENLKPILWTAKIAVGNEEIDEGHRAMFALFDAILSARKTAGKARLAALLEQLGDVTDAHFQSEEQLMSQFNYAHATAHKEEHRKALDEFAHQVDDWRDDRISAELLCRFMHRWLLRHIATLDIPLGEAIKRQTAGLAPH